MLVNSRNAGMSDAMKYSPMVSLTPMMSGDPFRAAMRVFSSCDMTRSAKRPSMCLIVAWIRSRSVPVCSPIKCAKISVSVSETNTWPRSWSSFLS